MVGYLVSRLVRWGLLKVFSRKQTPSFSRVMSKLAGSTVLTISVLMALTAVFASVKPVDLLAGLGFFSVAVGFAFQDILENTLSGVLLLFRQPLQSGDQRMVQDQSGTVEAITIRESRLATFDGKLVVMPNRDVYKSAIVVRTHFVQRRLLFMVGAAYENDATEVCEVGVQTLRSVDGVSADPAPEALISQLGVSTVDIEARFWADPSQHEARILTDRAIRAVKVALEDADIVALQATPCFRAAIQGDSDVTPGGGLKTA